MILPNLEEKWEDKMEKLEKRMYFFVPYNISPIQQAIQAGHAAVEYARLFGHGWLFKDFAENWKTWIVLNGGTTNNSIDPETGHFSGTLNQLRNEIIQFNFEHRQDNNLDATIDYADFYEPDLNDAMTAICFIVDERVFNYDDYPDFQDWIRAQDFVNEDEKLNSFISLEGLGPEQLKELFPGMYPMWVREMGGDKTLFLRELLRGKKLA